MVRASLKVLAIAVVSIVSASVLSSATAQLDEPDGTVSYSMNDVIKGKPVKGSAEYNQLFVQQTAEINSMILGPFLPASVRAQLPHTLATWLRNWLAGTILYFLSGGFGTFKVLVWERLPAGCLFRGQNYVEELHACNGWHSLVLAFSFATQKSYKTFHMTLFKLTILLEANKLKKEPVVEQVLLGLVSLPVLTALPTFAEYIVEMGWTQCYAQLAEVGWVNWAVHVFTYLAFCEFWVYWFHRLLHVPFFYKHLHRTHHFYNKLDTVSPFAGLAFNPFDGILQASPLVFALLLIPMHFRTYYILFFLEEIWSGNIHDTMDGGYFGILGAGYHNYHHTHFKYNYGHLTIGMDWLFGTLIDPRTDPKPKSEKALKSS